VDLAHVLRAVDGATAIASTMFCGPSGASAVAGRMAQVSTTGLAGANSDCSNCAVSSSVSVPCVITMPCTSSCASQCAQRCASRAHTALSMSLLSICATCSVCNGRSRKGSIPASSWAIPSVAAV
jgi:hypothetical protein